MCADAILAQSIEMLFDTTPCRAWFPPREDDRSNSPPSYAEGPPTSTRCRQTWCVRIQRKKLAEYRPRLFSNCGRSECFDAVHFAQTSVYNTRGRRRYTLKSRRAQHETSLLPHEREVHTRIRREVRQPGVQMDRAFRKRHFSEEAAQPLWMHYMQIFFIIADLWQ